MTHYVSHICQSQAIPYIPATLTLNSLVNFLFSMLAGFNLQLQNNDIFYFSLHGFFFFFWHEWNHRVKSRQPVVWTISNSDCTKHIRRSLLPTDLLCQRIRAGSFGWSTVLRLCLPNWTTTSKKPFLWLARKLSGDNQLQFIKTHPPCHCPKEASITKPPSFNTETAPQSGRWRRWYLRRKIPSGRWNTY
jgi:hypothetical protein